MERQGAATVARAGSPTRDPATTGYGTPAERRKAAMATALAASRAASPIIQAAQTPLTPTEVNEWEARSARQQRAKDAQRAGQRTAPPPRADRPPPRPSRLYAPPMACDAARDTRLSSGAVRCLQIIHALQRGHQPRPTKAWLAEQIGVSARQVQRYLAELREWGYIATDLIRTAAGWVVGQVVQITDAVKPYFWRRRSKTGGKLGETSVSPYQIAPLSDSTSEPAPLDFAGLLARLREAPS